MIILFRLAIIFGLLTIYLAINLLLPRLCIPAAISLYLIQPSLWMILIGLVLKIQANKYSSSHGVQLKSRSIGIAAITGIGQIASYLVAGLFTGFGNNSAQFKFITIFGLIFYLALSLIGAELSRVWLIDNTHERNRSISVISVSFFLFIFGVPILEFSRPNTGAKEAIETIFLWIPLLAESLFAGVLALRSGATPAVIYRGLILFFWYFFPILPKLDPTLKCFIGTVTPSFGFIALNLSYGKEQWARRSKYYRKSTDRFPTGWVAAGVLVLIITWFVSGLLPFWPLVVASGSMSPAIKIGDVVIVEKSSIGHIKTGNVVAFQKEDTTVIHRVIGISRNESLPGFLTQGDSNNTPDQLVVDSTSLMGKVVFVIPKLGWISLRMKELV